MTTATFADESGATAPRIAISSTTEELEPYRAVADEVARELGFAPLLVERPTGQPSAAGAGTGVQEFARRVTAADLLLAIIGWRRGEVPEPELGGDGLRSWTGEEVRAALRGALPVVVMMTGDGWPRSPREEDPEARAWLLDFRGDLHSLATFFEPEDEPTLATFRALVRRELARHAADGGRPDAGGTVDAHEDHPRLRSWPAPELPERPYPVLLPYTHPRLLAGRERECAALVRRLRLPVPILGLYAASGAGKSSLLLGALVPALRAGGQPVAVVRHPAEPGLAGRLIGDLLAIGDGGVTDLDDDDRAAFDEGPLAPRDPTPAPPVLVGEQ